MLEDDELPGALRKRVNATLRSDFSLKLPADESERELNPEEETAEGLFSRMAPDDELLDVIARWLMLGVGLGTIDWTTRGGLWVPSVRALPTEFLHYDHERREWIYQTKQGEQVVTPGDGKWILMAAGQEPWNWGLIRSLAVLWLGKQLTLGDWQRYNQKHGLPLIKAMVPLTAAAGEKEDFVSDLAALQAEGVIGLPQAPEGEASYDIELLEAKDTSWEAFKESLARSDRKIQCTVLGSNIGTEQTADTGGARAAAETSVKGLDDQLAKSDAKFLGKTLQEQLLAPFFRLNYGPERTIPFPFWDTCPEDNVQAQTQSQSLFVEMLGKLPAAGFKLKNLEALAAQHGMELEESEQGPLIDREPKEPMEPPSGRGAPPNERRPGDQ